MKKKYGFLYMMIGLMFLWFFPLSVRAGENPQSRALIIGRGDYGSASFSLSPGPENDAANFKRVLLQAYGDDVVITEKEKDGVTTVSGVTSAIADAFADSADDTINYFYYVGHGTGNGLYLGSEIMSAEQLAQAFSQIPGTHILVIDSCYSGALISRSGSTADIEAQFADTFIEAFSEAVAALKRSRSALNSTDFHVITAASSEEESWQAALGEDGEVIGLFTGNLVYGCGIDAGKVASDADYSLGTAPADYDQNGSISFDEIYQFIQNQNFSSHVRKYPEYDDTMFLPANQLTAAAATIAKAEISYDQAGSPLLLLTHQVRQDTQLEYAYYSGSLWSLTTLMKYCHTSSFVQTTSPVYQAGGSYPIGAGESTSVIALADGGVSLTEGNYAVLIRAQGDTYSYLLPFVISGGQDDSLMDHFQVSGAESFTADGSLEYGITADFGTAATDTAIRPYVSAKVLDSSGETVRSLDQNQLADVIAAGAFYKYYKKFYWDGTNDDRNIVPAGDYQVVVTANSGSRELTAAIWVRLEEAADTDVGTEQTDSETESETPSQTATEQKQETAGTNSQTGNQQIAVSAITLKVNGKNLSKKKLVIGRKEKVTLTPVVSPANASQKTVTYRSSNTKIVSVSAKGVVKGKKTGSAKITASTVNGKKYTITIKVKKAPMKVTLKANKKTLKKNQTYKIKVQLPKKSASYKITFKSSQKKVAKVSAAGVVTAKKKGTAMITVKTYNGKRVRLKITVK